MCTPTHVCTHTGAHTHKHVCAHSWTHPGGASDSPGLTLAPRTSAGPGADTGQGGGEEQLPGSSWGLRNPRDGAEGALGGGIRGWALWSGLEKSPSGNRAFPRTMGCRVSELGGRLCVRNGAWQPFRGLRQTSSRSVLPSRAGPGGRQTRTAHPCPGGSRCLLPSSGKLSWVGGAQVGDTLGAGLTGTRERRGHSRSGLFPGKP